MSIKSRQIFGRPRGAAEISAAPTPAPSAVSFELRALGLGVLFTACFCASHQVRADEAVEPGHRKPWIGTVAPAVRASSELGCPVDGTSPWGPSVLAGAPEIPPPDRTGGRATPPSKDSAGPQRTGIPLPVHQPNCGAFPSLDRSQDFEAEAALAMARSITGRLTRTTALAQVAAASADAGRLQAGRESFSEALRAAQDTRGVHARRAALERVAASMAASGMFVESAIAAHQIDDPWLRDRALAGLVRAQCRSGLTSDAFKTLSVMENGYWRALALAEIASAEAVPGGGGGTGARAADAVSAARRIRVDHDRAAAMASVAASMKDAMPIGEVAALFSEARSIAAALEPAADQLLLLADLATAEMRAGFAEEASRLLSEVLLAAHGMDDAWARAAVRTRVSAAFAESGRFRDALRTVDMVVIDGRRVEGLALIAKRLGAAPAPRTAKASLFAEALRVARRSSNAWRRGQALADVASAMARSGLPAEAMAAIDSEASRHVRAPVLRAIAEALAADGRAAEALELARSIRDPDERLLAELTVMLAPRSGASNGAETLAAAARTR